MGDNMRYCVDRTLGSIIHILYGILTSISTLVGEILPLVMAILFLYYQHIESKYELVENTLGDIIEYGIGVVVGLIALITHKLFL